MDGETKEENCLSPHGPTLSDFPLIGCLQRSKGKGDNVGH